MPDLPLNFTETEAWKSQDDDAMQPIITRATELANETKRAVMIYSPDNELLGRVNPTIPEPDADNDEHSDSDG